jgi:hypothetical protein
MDSIYRTPLLDLFRRGEVPDDVRMLAARGALAPRAHEQLALLILLTDDQDEGISMAANETLGRVPREALATFLARSDVGDEVREFFRRRGVEPAPVASEPAGAAEQPLVVADGDSEAPPQQEDKEATAQRLSRLSVAERIKCAMLGTREERFILIRDVNRLVAAAVLASPKVNESDVEAFAKMANVSEDVLRTIGHSRGWMKRYTVAASLAMNPKTPIAVSLGLVGRLVERDLKMIMRDRNMQEPLRAAARRLVANSETRKT